MKTLSDLLLTMYEVCLDITKKQKAYAIADALIDVKKVLDYYLKTEIWPDFWVYYGKNCTEIFINDLDSNLLRYAKNVYPNGTLVKYSLSDEKYIAELVLRLFEI